MMGYNKRGRLSCKVHVKHTMCSAFHSSVHKADNFLNYIFLVEDVKYHVNEAFEHTHRVHNNIISSSLYRELFYKVNIKGTKTVNVKNFVNFIQCDPWLHLDGCLRLTSI